MDFWYQSILPELPESSLPHEIHGRPRKRLGLRPWWIYLLAWLLGRQLCPIPDYQLIDRLEGELRLRPLRFGEGSLVPSSTFEIDRLVYVPFPPFPGGTDVL